MSKHTPAPWEWEVRYSASVDSIRHWALIGANGRPIIICDKGTPNDFGDGENADACLIDSAPELLGALKELTERYKKVMGVSSDGWVNMANQVIAKAEGKERSIYCQLDENSYCTHCSGHEHLCRQAIAKAEGAEFYCSEWSRVGYICDEGQCGKCAKAEGNP